MKLTHKPGGEYGIDYGVVVVFLLWIVATIVLLTMLAIRSRADSLAVDDTPVFVYDRSQPWFVHTTPRLATSGSGEQPETKK
jgi:hypothetical protein